MTKLAQVNWDSIIVVLAVVDHGSVAAAARALEINHATVLRRLADFEQSVGMSLFEKSPRGYQLTANRLGIIETMREAMDALGSVERMVEIERPRLKGGLRITTTDTLAQSLLPPILAQYSQKQDLPVELVADNSHLDFKRMEAHLTVRPAVSLPSELDGIRAGTLRFGAYAAPGAMGGWLGMSGALSRAAIADWVRRQADQSLLSADSFMSLATLAATGAGRAVLPTYVGENWPGLVRLKEPNDLKPVPIWVAAHVDFAKSGRINRARKFIASALAALPELSDGA